MAPRSLCAGIFDVDGVLLASPHEEAWREAIRDYADPSAFTTALYQADVAGKPRVDGALAALKAMGVADPETKARAYGEAKQVKLEALIAGGAVKAFPDALRFVQAVHELGWRLGVASSSKNANAMMEGVRLPSGVRLLDVFSANVCGRDLAHGKPDPELFLITASELHAEPADCFVVEDAPAGIEAARAGGMAGLGVARLHDGRGLREAGADLVVTSLGDVNLAALKAGRLSRRGT
jgi:HAD superfamily hydrolase (TIGR01509 family)